MENIIQQIDGKTYILINDVVKWDSDLSKKKEKVKELGGIFQGIYEKKHDFFGDIQQIKFRVLLPFDKAKEY